MGVPMSLKRLPDGQIADPPVQPFLQKYSGFLFTQITSTSIAIPHRVGAYRDRHERWCGMRWTRHVRRAVARGRMTLRADGEVVWS